MPELPEVETVVRDLREPLVGRRITHVTAGRLRLRTPWRPAWRKDIVNRQVIAVDRRGKWIIIDVDGPILLVHLGMTGQFVVTGSDIQRQNHTHLVFTLDNGCELRFRDIRRFGSAALFSSRADVEAHFQKSGLGPEPFNLDPGAWFGNLRKTNRCLKAILLDQRVVAGVGNIYADESLFEARLHPTLLGKNLKAPQAERLRQAIVTVLERAIKCRGSSIRDYVGGSGLKGEYQEEFRVYGRTDEPCTGCGQPIHRIRLAGRSTHFCPRCQKRA